MWVFPLLMVLLVASSARAADDCDRACLRTTLNQYLAAVSRHDPAAAPLFPGFRQTENAVVRKLGAGMWQTMTGLGRLQRFYMDPVTGQAAYFGIVNEGNNEAIVTVRLRVENAALASAVPAETAMSS